MKQYRLLGVRRIDAPPGLPEWCGCRYGLPRIDRPRSTSVTGMPVFVCVGCVGSRLWGLAAGRIVSELGDVIRLAEVLGALSLTTDLGAGVPFEKGLRTCVVASALAEALELERAERHAVYFAALLRSLGCTAHASAFAEMFDDDVALQRELKTLDLVDPGLVSAQTARFATWAPGARGSTSRRAGPSMSAAPSTRAAPLDPEREAVRFAWPPIR